ncbi:hypothetical protein KFK09_014499 [Dendrobium nobile]|uniref:Uncharacterized protein n=1 Tax=Dendrobium nobile TaxID=94219 RepID=A0A8T3B3J2_DENNO|nr:hypothetical protein KFK09_014499 [Dendrobium nobile]
MAREYACGLRTKVEQEQESGGGGSAWLGRTNQRGSELLLEQTPSQVRSCSQLRPEEGNREASAFSRTEPMGKKESKAWSLMGGL